MGGAFFALQVVVASVVQGRVVVPGEVGLQVGGCSSCCGWQWNCEVKSIEASPVVLLVGAVGKLADQVEVVEE